jgi:hypothetical protein
MPNWCWNKLEIIGEKEQLESFLEKFGDEFKLSKIIAPPEEMRGIHTGFCTIDGVTVNNWRVDEKGDAVLIPEQEKEYLLEKYKALGWYNWALAHWGTKWDVDPCEIAWVEEEEEEPCLQAHFDSAWSPPEEAIETLSKQYPDIYFRLYFCEPGCSFAGIKEFNAGNSFYDDYEDDMREAVTISPWHEDMLQGYLEDLDEDEEEEESAE